MEKDITFEQAWDLFAHDSDFDPWGSTRMYAIVEDGLHSPYVDGIKSLQNLESRAEFFTRIYLVSNKGMFPPIRKA